jgi:hypothetical protein
MAESTVELMRRPGVESAAVVGYSDGGISASTWRSITLSA